MRSSPRIEEPASTLFLRPSLQRQGRQNRRREGAGGCPPQILVDILTYFKSREDIIPTTMLLPPRIFRSSYGTKRQPPERWLELMLSGTVLLAMKLGMAFYKYFP